MATATMTYLVVEEPPTADQPGYKVSLVFQSGPLKGRPAHIARSKVLSACYDSIRSAGFVIQSESETNA